VTWSIEVRGGVAHWDGDLRNLQLAAIDVRGGVSQVDLRLPRPAGTVPIRVTGGVSHLTIHRPGSVPSRVHIGGGVSKLQLDTQYLGAIGGPVRLELITPAPPTHMTSKSAVGRARSRSNATNEGGAAERRPSNCHRLSTD
jgi:hypothetical protein